MGAIAIRNKVTRLGVENITGCSLAARDGGLNAYGAQFEDKAIRDRWQMRGRGEQGQKGIGKKFPKPHEVSGFPS
jgi:hypothetical protein